MCTFARHLLDLQPRITELEAAVAELLAGDEDGRRLCQIPGIGPNGAATIRAELGDVARFGSVDEVVLRRAGPAHPPGRGLRRPAETLQARHRRLRHALYLATLVATRSAAEWRVRYHRLLDGGRVKKGALTILSRALLKVISHLLRTGDRYGAARLRPLPASSPASGA